MLGYVLCLDVRQPRICGVRDRAVGRRLKARLVAEEADPAPAGCDVIRKLQGKGRLADGAVRAYDDEAAAADPDLFVQRLDPEFEEVRRRRVVHAVEEVREDLRVVPDSPPGPHTQHPLRFDKEPPPVLRAGRLCERLPQIADACQHRAVLEELHILAPVVRRRRKLEYLAHLLRIRSADVLHERHGVESLALEEYLPRRGEEVPLDGVGEVLRPDHVHDLSRELLRFYQQRAEDCRLRVVVG